MTKSWNSERSEDLVQDIEALGHGEEQRQRCGGKESVGDIGKATKETQEECSFCSIGKAAGSALSLELVKSILTSHHWS
jgi:hypothetical protein